MKIVSKLIIIVGICILFCSNDKTNRETISSLNNDEENISTPKNNDEENIPICDGFDYPVGKPNGKGYYNAQKFGENTHLGEDWNGVRGGNSDLGDLYIPLLMD
jgi:hypothetical protein